MGTRVRLTHLTQLPASTSATLAAMPIRGYTVCTQRWGVACLNGFVIYNCHAVKQHHVATAAQLWQPSQCKQWKMQKTSALSLRC
jgi:hypothetical protein